MPDGSDLSAARRLLPEGSQVTGTVSIVPQPGVIGVFVDLPHGMGGFVDVLILPWTGEPPVVGSVGPYRIAAHRDVTRRIMVTPALVPPA